MNQMACVHCGISKNYPLDFPNAHYAQCYMCFVKEDLKDEQSNIPMVILFTLGAISIVFSLIYFMGDDSNGHRDSQNITQQN
jgi:hypothetical protein